MLRVLTNFERQEDQHVSLAEMLAMYSSDHNGSNKENEGEDPRPLISRPALGRIVLDVWGKEGVRSARLGKRGTKQMRCYINLKRKSRADGVASDQERDIVMQMEDVTVPANWWKVCNSTTSFSFFRSEKWILNGQRMITEIRINAEDHGSPNPRIEIVSQGFSLDIFENGLCKELKGLQLTEQVNLLMAFLDSPETGICCGFQLPVGQENLSVLSPHKVVDLSVSIDQPLEIQKNVFSQKCKLFAPPGQCCSACTVLKKRENEKKKINRCKEYKNLSSKCNDRWLSTDQLKKKMTDLKKELKNSVAREKRLFEKFQAELLDMEESDNTDLKSIMANVKMENIPPEMKLLWEQQTQILQTESVHGYRWHPK